MKQEELELIQEISRKIIKDVEFEVKKHINDDDAGDFVEMGADGTPTKQIDVYAENKVIENLKNLDFKSFLISEESGELFLGKGESQNIDLLEFLNNENLEEEFKAKNECYPKFIFVVDPLDGTNNAIKQIPAFGISIAVAEIEGLNRFPNLTDIVLGFVKDFSSGDCYEAIKNQGAFLNGEKISPSNLKSFSKATLGGFIDLKQWIIEFLMRIRRLRVLGSVAIESSFVASGAYDIFFDLRSSRILDIAASKLIIEESGAIITDTYGRKLKNNLTISEKVAIIVSGNKTLHEKIIKEFEYNNYNNNQNNLVYNGYDYHNNNHERNKGHLKHKNSQIKKIGVISRLDSENSILLSGMIIQELLKNNIKVKVEKDLAIKLEEFKKGLRVSETVNNLYSQNRNLYNQLKDLKLTTNFKELSSSIENFKVDAVITFGGDGTILMAKNKLDSSTPFFAVNMGTVGFLTNVESNEIKSKLKKLFKGQFYKEKRNQIKISYGNKRYSALNELVIMTQQAAKILDFEISIDGEVVEEFRADGVIISTPSGSTAYAMSAGGPIVDPDVDAIIIIPICPYKLNIRPFVVSQDSLIEIKLLSKSKNAVMVVDGQINQDLKAFDEIKVEKSSKPVYFIKTDKKDFYEKVKHKLIEN
ncbi:MAG: NAD(+)/NADH kinase [Methanobrevibacter sp.]|jgi:NAD+ kinase|nr:NAD(+)/NADH kinase [Candidatus Methanoflexus mossambicus]